VSDSLRAGHQRGVFQGKFNNMFARFLTIKEVFIIISIYCLNVDNVRREFEIGVIFGAFALSS
jgi:hypothetical protein